MYRQRKGFQIKGRYCDPCGVFYPSHKTGYITECPKCFGKLQKNVSGASKYRNKKVEWRGKMIDSKKERDEVMVVDYMLKAGDIASYDTQVEFPLYVNGMPITTYIADIVIYHKDGTTEVREVKSKFTDRLPTWRMKKKLFEATYLKENPTWRLTVID
jgi:hypothetical protein